jgi:hypothetical protein
MLPGPYPVAPLSEPARSVSVSSASLVVEPSLGARPSAVGPSVWVSSGRLETDLVQRRLVASRQAAGLERPRNWALLVVVESVTWIEQSVG